MSKRKQQPKKPSCRGFLNKKECRQRRPKHSINLYSPPLKNVKGRETLITQSIINPGQRAERNHWFRPSNKARSPFPKLSSQWGKDNTPADQNAYLQNKTKYMTAMFVTFRFNTEKEKKSPSIFKSFIL